MGTLCAQLLLQFDADSFETSQVFWSWSEDVHVVWILSSDYILSLSLQFELSLFSGIITIKIIYVDSMYLVRVTPPINFTFSDGSLFLGGQTYINLI